MCTFQLPASTKLGAHCVARVRSTDGFMYDTSLVYIFRVNPGKPVQIETKPGSKGADGVQNRN